jgi:hypothetical protein
MDETLVQRLVEQGEDMTLNKVLYNLITCSMHCSFDPGWKEFFEKMKTAVDEEWPGAVEWSGGLYICKKGFDFGQVIVPEHIKENYVRCLLYSEGHR